MEKAKLAGSFRDPDGFLFHRDGRLYRQINERYQAEYELLMGSGLYDSLVRSGSLVPHEEADISFAFSAGACRVIRPEPVPFVSYPYEWCFSGLKSAALLTLDIERRALEAGMTLKDASSYNVQFRGCSPLFIDTLSFERYEEGRPWAAYRQFCQHFLAPLALMSRTDVRLGSLMRIYLDGVPLDLAASLLPARTRLSFGLQTHIHIHSRYQRRYSQSGRSPGKGRMGKNAMLGLVDSLEGTVRKLSYHPAGTEWSDYYGDTNYTGESMKRKEALVSEFLGALRPETVWDLGANTGRFSRIAAARCGLVVAFDVDPAAVERHFTDGASAAAGTILPLLLDLANPSPGIGWAGEERSSIEERGPADAVLALALLHHLAISNNLPFEDIAGYLARLCRFLVIEFVPKEDSQVERLLVTRKDIFDRYTKDHFEQAFGALFTVERSEPIEGSGRVLYMMRRR
ncbi:MAG TPA: SAM-dependent methyltransferase [Candidatus Eisenbacteria bacterium]|uniref:SAM-dependent methyltransferase n=1 Tax=Eiseniibacteriota bacterium TaxID=2212470 RepID=A0A7V2F317_UNCEI|nr:SAM-dependent methyltransferase [Candidatus Eisenbacteria bacterium]